MEVQFYADSWRPQPVALKLNPYYEVVPIAGVRCAFINIFPRPQCTRSSLDAHAQALVHTLRPQCTCSGLSAYAVGLAAHAQTSLQPLMPCYSLSKKLHALLRLKLHFGFIK